MMYISLFLLGIAGSIGNLYRNFPARTFYNLLFLVILVIVALRFASVDYFQYQWIYEEINDVSSLGFFTYEVNDNTPIESGFALLILLEKLVFGYCFSIFVAVFAIISLTIKAAAFKKLSPYILLSVLLYLSDEYFWKDLGQIRNGMASGIVLWAFYYAYLQRFISFLILVFIATLFHGAALIVLPFYLLGLGLFQSRIFLSFSLFVSVLIVIIFGGIGFLFFDVANLMGLDDNARFIKYYSSDYVDGSTILGGTFNLQLLICIFLIFFYKKLVIKWPINSLFIPIYILGTCLFLVFIDYGIISGRIRDMVTVPVACIVLPSTLLIFKGYAKLVPFLFIVFYSSLWFFMMMQDRAPYESILQFISWG